MLSFLKKYMFVIPICVLSVFALLFHTYYYPYNLIYTYESNGEILRKDEVKSLSLGKLYYETENFYKEKK